MAEDKQMRNTVPEGSVKDEEPVMSAETESDSDEMCMETTAAGETHAASPEDSDDFDDSDDSDDETVAEAADATDDEEDAAEKDAAEDENAAAAEQPERSSKEWIPANVREAVGDVMDTCESVVVAMFVVLLIFTYLFSVAVVEGDSMLPTLQDADRLLLINFADPEPGDVVVLNSDSAYTFDAAGQLKEDGGLGKKIVKRLIAEANQTVDIDFAAGIVYVDGKPLAEPYTSTLTTRDEGAFTYPITVPEGYVFVLGDNRSVSKDSRHPDVGLIPEEDIVGKVWLRVYPLDDFTKVE
ncbi:MAG: signal peptidase I [Oscillospiraceae bacterium]|nr:signal peptidase I [Oscillospiraceae bacterium]